MSGGSVSPAVVCGICQGAHCTTGCARRWSRDGIAHNDPIWENGRYRINPDTFFRHYYHECPASSPPPPAKRIKTSHPDDGKETKLPFTLIGRHAQNMLRRAQQTVSEQKQKEKADAVDNLVKEIKQQAKKNPNSVAVLTQVVASMSSDHEEEDDANGIQLSPLNKDNWEAVKVGDCKVPVECVICEKTDIPDMHILKGTHTYMCDPCYSDDQHETIGFDDITK